MTSRRRRRLPARSLRRRAHCHPAASLLRLEMEELSSLSPAAPPGGARPLPDGNERRFQLVAEIVRAASTAPWGSSFPTSRREEILAVHARSKPMAEGVDLARVAHDAVGMNGARTSRPSGSRRAPGDPRRPCQGKRLGEDVDSTPWPGSLAAPRDRPREHERGARSSPPGEASTILGHRGTLAGDVGERDPHAVVSRHPCAAGVLNRPEPPRNDATKVDEDDDLKTTISNPRSAASVSPPVGDPPRARADRRAVESPGEPSPCAPR